jgi:TRAP-type uncharacterized transport system fused permease subunit
VGIAWASATGLIGTALLAAGLEGFILTTIPVWLRGGFFLSAVNLMMPGIWSDQIGFALAFL